MRQAIFHTKETREVTWNIFLAMEFNSNAQPRDEETRSLYYHHQVHEQV